MEGWEQDEQAVSALYDLDWDSISKSDPEALLADKLHLISDGRASLPYLPVWVAWFKAEIEPKLDDFLDPGRKVLAILNDPTHPLRKENVVALAILLMAYFKLEQITPGTALSIAAALLPAVRKS